MCTLMFPFSFTVQLLELTFPFSLQCFQFRVMLQLLQYGYTVDEFVCVCLCVLMVECIIYWHPFGSIWLKNLLVFFFPTIYLLSIIHTFIYIFNLRYVVKVSFVSFVWYLNNLQVQAKMLSYVKHWHADHYHSTQKSELELTQSLSHFWAG